MYSLSSCRGRRTLSARRQRATSDRPVTLMGNPFWRTPVRRCTARVATGSKSLTKHLFLLAPQETPYETNDTRWKLEKVGRGATDQLNFPYSNCWSHLA